MQKSDNEIINNILSTFNEILAKGYDVDSLGIINIDYDLSEKYRAFTRLLESTNSNYIKNINQKISDITLINIHKNLFEINSELDSLLLNLRKIDRINKDVFIQEKSNILKILDNITSNLESVIFCLKNENSALIKDEQTLNAVLSSVKEKFLNEIKYNQDNLFKIIEKSKSDFSELEIQKDNLENKIRELDSRNIKLATTIQDLNNLVSNEILNLKKHLEHEAKSEISDLVSNLEKYRDSIIEAIDNDLKICIEHHKKMDDKLQLTLATTRESHKDFINIVEKAGIYELTQNYSQKADDEKQEYKDYRKFTTWAILAAIAATLVIFALPIIESWLIGKVVHMDYFTLFARLTISIMFFALAFYTSKQAGKHYECYQENHRTYLQLAALEPFISRMNDDDKLAIRKELISVYFNKTDDGKFAAKGNEVDLPSNWTSIVHKLIDTVKESKQSSKDD